LSESDWKKVQCESYGHISYVVKKRKEEERGKREERKKKERPIYGSFLRNEVWLYTALECFLGAIVVGQVGTI
jgi:hypothetical protein